MAGSQILNLYFCKYKYLAFAVAYSGTYAGMIVWPVVSQLLFDKYGYSIAMGVMFAAHLTHILAAILMVQPSQEPPDLHVPSTGKRDILSFMWIFATAI